MTDFSKIILEKYQIRKSKKQKNEFISLIKNYAEQNEYPFSVEKGAFGAKNLVVGSPDTAKIIFTAHYDTCPRLPFPNFITPKNIFIYLIYQVVLTVVLLGALSLVMFAVSIPVDLLLNFASADPYVRYNVFYYLNLGLLLGFLYLMMSGPANKHTANDNTSGVITLTELMQSVPKELRDSVAFVFFDLEETGLFGSSGFASKHKELRASTPVINFDCVSDGQKILIALNKKAEAHREMLEKSFVSNEKYTVEIRSKGVFYPSDQMNFKKGVGVAALKHSNFLRTDYMDRIHTNRDTVFCEENIEFLTECSLNSIAFIAEPKGNEV